MNKEEIEKEDKEHLIKVLTEHKDYIFEFDDDNIKIEYILDYIRELEFQNTALKAEHNHNITRIKELEQKESILDKVTDKLKKVGNKYIKEYKNVEKLDLIQQNTAVLQELSCVIDDIEEILEIIEGEKND